MIASSVKQQVFDIHQRIQPHLDAREDHHERLFEVFRELDAAIAECEAGDETADARAAGLIEAQTVVIRTAAALPARCTRDLLYKLAIWRWDAPDLEVDVENMNRADAIAYSTFLDLSKMLGATDVLKDFDKTS